MVQVSLRLEVLNGIMDTDSSLTSIFVPSREVDRRVMIWYNLRYSKVIK